MAGLVWSACQSYRKVGADQRQSLRIKELQGVIIHLDEVLTMSARMAAATGDLAWERRYRQFEPQLDAAVKEATALTAQSGRAKGAAQTDAANLKLVEMENKSFAPVHEGRAEAARAILFSREYETQKRIYAEGAAELDRQLGESVKSHEKEQRREAVFCLLASAAVVGLLLLTWLTVLSRLRHWRTVQLRSFDQLAHAEEELRNAHSLLERRVEERTAELRQASLEAQANEARLRAITDSAQDAILMMDPEGRVSYWNPAAERILGYTGAEAIGQNLHKLIAPARHHPAHRAALPAFLQTGQGAAVGKTLDLEARRKDGQEISVQLSLSAIQINGGWHAVGIMRDITERKRMEEKLRQLSQAMEQSPASVVITDTAGNIEYVNPKFIQVTGYTLADVLGKNPRVLKSGEKSPEAYRELWQTITSGKEWRGEFHNQKKNGELYWESASISPIRDVAGRVTHYVAVKEDITARKRAEEALCRSEAKFRTLYDSGSDAVMLLDQKGFFDCNPATLAMFGCATREEFCSRHPADLSPSQ
jgi:PAS domain S-box-containing protein